MAAQAPPAIPINIEREFEKIEKLNDRLIRRNERLLKSASLDAQKGFAAGTNRHTRISNLREKLASISRHKMATVTKKPIERAVSTKER